MSDLAGSARALGGALDAFGSALVARFGPLNFWTAVLLAGALVLDRALAHRARAAWRVALYAPIGLRVVLPLDWSLHIPSAPRVVDYFTPPLQMFGVRAAAEASAGRGVSWHALAAVIYVVVAALLAARAVFARLELRRAIAAARPVPSPLPVAPCPVVAHEELGPMAVGLIAPRIVLPQRLLAPGEEHALDCVLRHEAAHLRRGDGWLSAAMQVIAVAAWPVVPLWIAVARVRQLVELACDEAALAGADATERRRYGHALLDMAEQQMRFVTPMAGELHFGSTLRARIEALATQRHWPIAAQAAALVVASLALMGASSGSAPSATVPAGGAGPADDTGYGYQFEVDSAKNTQTDPAALTLTHGAGDRLPPETVQAIVRSHYAALSSCYEAGVKREPTLTGTVTVKAVVGEDGVTKQAVDEGSTLPDREVVACIVGELGKATFPRGGGELTFVYPVQFAP